MLSELPDDEKELVSDFNEAVSKLWDLARKKPGRWFFYYFDDEPDCIYAAQCLLQEAYEEYSSDESDEG
jgi:hypothetical protein